jgi:hypothetical protein
MSDEQAMNAVVERQNEIVKQIAILSNELLATVQVTEDSPELDALKRMMAAVAVTVLHERAGISVAVSAVGEDGREVLPILTTSLAYPKATGATH